jgi:hypothetical protein
MTILTTGPVLDLAERRRIWALSNERAAWLRRVLRSWQDGWQQGYDAGYRDGREAEGAQRDRLWHLAADPAARGGPAYTELERRRYGPGGRKRFGEARSGDYQGGPVPWERS